MKLNELRYNNEGDFRNFEKGDVIVVFQGYIYSFHKRFEFDSVQQITDLARKMCNVFPRVSDNIFYEDGSLLPLYAKKPLSVFEQFYGFPKLLVGVVDTTQNGLCLNIDNDYYDILNSKEFDQLVKSGALAHEFTFVDINGHKEYVSQILNDRNNVSSDKNIQLSNKLYHGTTDLFIYQILKKGIRKVQDNSLFKFAKNDGYIFLTNDFNVAEKYARMYANTLGGNLCVVEVNSTAIDTNNIVSDYDFVNKFGKKGETNLFNSEKTDGEHINYKGQVVSNGGRYGTKFQKIGYKGVIYPNAIQNIHIMYDNSWKTMSPQEVIKMKEDEFAYDDFEDMMESRQTKPKHKINEEYVSCYYEGKENFKFTAYHTVRYDKVVELWYDGKLDPKVEHPGECPWDVIWFTIDPTSYQGSFQFSFEIDPKTFKEFGFKWVNDIHLVCDKPINIMDKRLKIYRHAGFYVDEVFENNVKNRSNDELNYFFDTMFNSTDNEISNELFAEKLLQQFNIPRVWFWGEEYEDDNIEEDVKKVRQGIMQYEEKLNEVEASDIQLNSFEVKDNLHPKFWINGKINSRVRLKLLDLADEFFDSLSVSWVKPKDIIMTGSLANYNWSRYSDIDVHIMVDFNDVWKKKEFVRDYFDSKKELWAQEHKSLKIYGFPVEMYVEDINEDNPSSGRYSLNKNKWLVEPNNFQDAELNQDFVKKESAKIMTEIEDVEEKISKEKDNQKLERLSERMKKLFDKLHKKRSESLEKNGEFGVYNIIWKVLRRSGHLDIMWDIINSVYNKVNSIK